MKTYQKWTISGLLIGLLATLFAAGASARSPVSAEIKFDDNTVDVWELKRSTPTTQPTDPVDEPDTPVEPEPEPEVVPVPTFTAKQIVDQRVRVQISHVVPYDVIVRIKTKASDWILGVIPAGSLGMDYPKVNDTPLNINWQYWIWAETNEWKSGEVEILIIPPEPVVTPTPNATLPSWAQLPTPPPDVQRPNNVVNALAAIASGKPTYIDGIDFKTTTLRLINSNNVWITNSNFITPTGGWGTGHSIRMQGQVKNVFIFNNTFNGPNGDAAIAGGDYKSQSNLRDVLIFNNDFKKSSEGIHIFGKINGDSRYMIYRNSFIGIRRMGVEVQEGGEEVLIAENDYREPAVKANGYVYGPDVFGYSVATVEVKNVTIRNNVAVGNALSRWVDADRLGMAFECAGRKVIVDGNIVVGPFINGFSVLSGYSDTIKTVATLSNNIVIGVPPNAMGWGKPIAPNGGSTIIMGGNNLVSHDVDWSKIPAKGEFVGRK